MRVWRGKLEMTYIGVNARRTPRGRAATRSSARLAACVLALASACASPLSRDVPREGDNEVREYLGDASRAPAAEVALDDDTQQAWRADAGRGSLGAVAMGERITAVATPDRWLYLLDTRTGQTFWRWRSETPFSTGPLIAAGRVYAASEGVRGRLVAIDVPSGKRRWNAMVGDVSAPITYRGGTVYGATAGGTVFAYGADRGQRIWVRATGLTRAGPLVAGRWVVVPTITDSLFILDAATGALHARVGIGASAVAPGAVVNDSTIALSSPGGALLLVSVPSGDVRWRMETGVPIFGAPAVSGDTVFAITNRCTLWAVPVDGGRPADTLSLPRCVTQAGPALVRGGVLVATVEGDLVYLDRIARRQRWTRRVGGELRHPPMIRNGQIVVAPVIGDVVSFR